MTTVWMELWGTEMDTVALEEKISASAEDKPLYLFVCTGNTCRSPMAEAMFNFKYSRIARALSCGVTANGRSAIAKEAVAVLRDRGVPPDEYAGHISRPATAELLEAAERVIGMTGDHANYLITRFPEFAGKIYAMPKDVGDPYGGDKATYKRCLDAIEAGLDEAFGDGYT